MVTTNKPFVLHLFDDRVALERTSTGAALVISRTVPESPLEVFVDGKGLKETTGGQLVPVDAIFGIYHLLSGPYVALVTDSEISVAVSGMEFRKVTKAAIIPLFKSGVPLSEERQADEDKYLELLHLAISSHHFYFSYNYDVTRTLQRIATLDDHHRRLPLWQRADERFFWNRDLLNELISVNAHDWIVPMMNSFIDYRPNCSVKGGKHRFHLLFISRRSRFRQGCRFTMRGIDEEGHVANFVETEQILVHEDGRQSAFVQIRGSIPLYWFSPVCMKYTPRVYFGDESKSKVSGKKHVDELLDLYGKEGVVFVNLIDMKKDQQALGIRFKKLVDDFQLKNLRYVWFDFHHECKKMKYQNLSKLVREVDADFQNHSYFLKQADGSVNKLQQGVIRTNCLDNLDRTNVVQSLFGRRSLLFQLDEVSAAMEGDVLESPFHDFEKIFKDVWGNNADAISVLYSGTGALKTDFTRTGKRTVKGALQDGVNSVMRYYKNNFVDGFRQDSIDLMLGRYRPDATAPSPFTNPPAEQETLATFTTRIFVVLVATFSIYMILRPQEKALQKLFLDAVLTTFVILALMAYNLVKKGGKMGKKLVSKPRLVPEPYVFSFFSPSS